MKKVVLFVRVSTDKQHTESQMEALERAALADGYTKEQFIRIEKKESAVKLDESEREGLNLLKEAMENNEVDCVYIFELSRLSRRPLVLFSLREQFLASKVQLKCMNPQFKLLNEDRNNFDQMASIVFSLFGTFAEQEAIEKKERFHRGKGHLASQGRYAGGRIPYGYNIDYEKGKLIVINEQEAEVIRLIFNLYESGVSHAKIAKELRERGIRYRKFTGNGNQRGVEKDFETPYVHQLLTNELLTGRKLKGATASFERTYPPIISPEQFDRCRKIAKENSTWTDKERRVYYAYHLITCKECGCKYTGSGLKIGYRCYNAGMAHTTRALNGWSKPVCHNTTNISVNVMDSLAWYVAQKAEAEYIINAANFDKSKYEEKIVLLQQKIESIQAKLNTLDGRKQRVISLYLEGSIDDNRKTAEFKKMEDERLELLKQKVAVDTDIEHFRDLIDGLFKVYNFDLNDVNDTAANAEKILAIQKGIASIDSDYERFKLCQKHIQEIYVERRIIDYKFKTHWIGIKEAKVKYITLKMYNGDVYYYYFLPFDGHNGHFINTNAEGEVFDDADIPVIRRYKDTTKDKQRAKYKARKKAAYEKVYSPDKQYLRGIEEMAAYFGVARSCIARRISLGFFDEAISRFDKKTQIMDVEKALELLRASKNAWVKKILVKFLTAHPEKRIASDPLKA